ncbi:unnamed protein product [Lupinus luteus]|uniref:Uncharacterized protein n=1 Tax=Lupinus luteus TaxID=3873 RepID=A0AAV1WSN7_LUPLU
MFMSSLSLCGVSSFNQFIHELSVDSDTSSLEYSSGEEDIYGCESPQSQSSRASRASFSNYDRHHMDWIQQFSRDCNLCFHLFYLVNQDLHLGLEIFIECAFDVVHKAIHLLLSPSEAFETLKRLFSSHESGSKDEHGEIEDTSISTATLGENDPTPTTRTISFRQPLNTDARTCQDVITDIGRDARKAVYLQHGVLDSSMGWVSNGVVGSPAFAAYDQGYDVFLGNFRGLVSREHVNKNISSRQKIHELKTAELSLSKPDIKEEVNDEQLYKLCAICHSLGGAAMLMYVITRKIEAKPHRISRLILLSPAGFHHDSNLIISMVERVLLSLAPVLSRIFPAFYIPTRFFRMLVFKLVRDVQNLPALGGLVQTSMGYVVGGDSSDWVGVLGLPHYNMNDMPAVSFYVALHFAQIKRSRRFRMFDYGSVHDNMEVYGSPGPLDLGEHYELINIPVDLVGGQKDTVIRPSMVKKHYRLMKDAGVDVSYKEFEYAHLDFTFSHHEELLSYVMSRLMLVEPNPKHQMNQRGLRLRKKGHVSAKREEYDRIF